MTEESHINPYKINWEWHNGFYPPLSMPVTLCDGNGGPLIQSVWQLQLIGWLMGERGLREGMEIAKKPAAIRKWCHYHHCRDDPVTPEARANGREEGKTSPWDHQSVSHHNQLPYRLSDCTDVTINCKSNCNNIIPLQRVRASQGDYESGQGLKCL